MDNVLCNTAPIQIITIPNVHVMGNNLLTWESKSVIMMMEYTMEKHNISCIVCQ